MRQIRKLKELVAHINGQIEFIEHTFISNVHKSFQSKFKSSLYKNKKAELTAQWGEESKKIQTLLEGYKTQKETLDNIVTYILGGRAINSTIKGSIETIANTIDNYLDIVLDTLIIEYPLTNTIPAIVVSEHVARSRSVTRSPVRTRLQEPEKSVLRDPKRRMRNKSPNRSGSRSRNRNRNENRKTLRFKNRAEEYEIESLKTKNPFNKRSGVTHTTKEIKNMSRKGSINLSRIYGSTSIYRNKLRRWMGYADTRGMTGEAANVARKEARETAAMVRHMTGEAANVATEAAIAANAAAAEAQRIVSTVSHLSPIFQAIQPAADEASRAAQHAVELAHFAEESFSIGAAQGARDEAIKARSIAVRALEEIKRTTGSAPSSAAASSR